MYMDVLSNRDNCCMTSISGTFSFDVLFHLENFIFGKTDTNAFPFIRRNRLQSVYIRLNGSCKHLNGLLIRLKKFASV